MKVMSIAAHPDDTEILCAGALARLKAAGNEICIAALCNGDKGHKVIPAPELAAMRREEAARAAAVIGAESVVGLFPDLGVYVDKPSTDAVVELIRRVKPDFIITHSPDDYMMDHVNAGKLAVNASFIATLPNYKTGSPATDAICPVCFMDTLAGLGFEATEYVDVTGVMDIKEKMLRCHESQYRWLKEHDNIDYVEFMKQLNASRGQQCGVRYAEAFRPYAVWGRMKPYRLLP